MKTMFTNPMNEMSSACNDYSKTSKTNVFMKTATRELKSIINKVPEILCFTFESYLLGYKYQELSEMVKVAFTSFKAQQESNESVWSFKNWGRKK